MSGFGLRGSGSGSGRGDGAGVPGLERVREEAGGRLVPRTLPRTLGQAVAQVEDLLRVGGALRAGVALRGHTQG